jgi:hypothetical protein
MVRLLPDGSSAKTARRAPGVDAGAGLLVLGWLATRVACHAAGVRFDASPLGWFMQYLAPDLLRHDLARSLLALHAQPPLYNAFLGGVLKLGEAAAAWVFPSIHAALGLLLVLALYAILRRLGLGRGAAGGVAFLYGASPTAVLHESWLFYTHPLSAALVGAAFFLHRLVSTGRGRDAAAYFALVAAVALTRGLFHLVWVLACVLLALAWMRRPGRAVLACAACAVLAVGALYAKNAWLFGTFSASSWAGMNLANVAMARWSLEERRALVERGVVSELALVEPFAELAYYPGRRGDAGSDPPALREAWKAPGVPNYNHRAYIEVSRQYGRDALALVRADPARYWASVREAWRLYLLPPTDHPFLAANRAEIAALDRLYKALVYGVPAAWRGAEPGARRGSPEYLARHGCWLWLVAALVAGGAAAGAVARGLLARARGRPLAPDGLARLATLGFCLFQVLFVSAVANALELGENNRFRVPIEPLLVVLVADTGRGVARAFRSARARA